MRLQKPKKNGSFAEIKIYSTRIESRNAGSAYFNLPSMSRKNNQKQSNTAQAHEAFPRPRLNSGHRPWLSMSGKILMHLAWFKVGKT